MRAGDEAARAKQHALELEENNVRIQEQLMLNQLNEEQIALIKANAMDIEANVPAHFELNYRVLKFEARLGSGSFGDCFKGRKGGQPVAIKRMRVGLIDESESPISSYCEEREREREREGEQD